MIEPSPYGTQTRPAPAGPEIEIEVAIEGAAPEVGIRELPDGGIEIDMDPNAGRAAAIDEHEVNLAEVLDENDLMAMSNELMELYMADVASRKEWVQTLVEGLKVLGMKYEIRTDPWDGACGVFSTVLTEAAVRFQAESITETFPAQGPVKTKIIGAIDKLKEEAAERVRGEMNYQLTEAMPEYRGEHERMLYSLGLSGSAFKKVFIDPALGRQVSRFVPAEDLIVPYGETDLTTAQRVTHLMRKTKNDMKKLMDAGLYRTVELSDPMFVRTDIEEEKAKEQGFSLIEDPKYHVLEFHVEYNVPGLDDEKGIAPPYVITIEMESGKVLAVYRNWAEDDPLKLKQQHFVDYTYIPGTGFYGIGLVHLIGGYARAGTSIMRQLVDAGTLANLPGGFKTRGLRVKGEDDPIKPGEWRDVDVAAGTLKENMSPLPYKEPSPTLLQLLNIITEEGRRLGAIADIKISDMSSQAPVGTTLAILERTLKTMSAVQARVHFAMKREFKLLKELIAETGDEYLYVPEKGSAANKRADFDMVDVIPVSDPNSATMAQRVVQYQAVMQLAEKAPQIYNLPLLHRQMIEVLGVKNADQLVPTEDDMKPSDPVSENMGFLNGKPTKAFMQQDHAAHMAVHMAFIQDPMMAQKMGQNPMAQAMQQAVMAHIAEHMAFAYRQQIEQRLGAPLPQPNAEMSPEVEVQVSRLVADAAQQVLQLNTQQAQQEQAAQQAQDPVFQMQQADRELKAAEIERKKAKDAADNAIARQKLGLEERKVVVDAELEEQRQLIDVQRAGVMGRSADAQVLANDREGARKLLETIGKLNSQNQAGESGQKPPSTPPKE